MTGLLALATLICLLPLLLLLYYVIKMGISSINLDFFLNNPKPMGEAGGGMLNSIIGTIIVLAMASLIGIPIGLVTGIYLAENKGTKLAEWVRLATEVLVGIPSIVIGILVYGWLVKSMKTFSAFSGSIA